MERQGKRWTNEEVELLCSFAGGVSFQHMAKRLGRSPKAIEQKLCKLGLIGTRINRGSLSVNELASALKVDSKHVLSWREKYGLPIKIKNLRYGKKKYNNYHITAEQFWNWAENNKEVVDFFKIDKHAILPEPSWVDKERAKDYHNIPRRRKQYWTEEEDQTLWRMYYGESKLQKEIAVLLNRSKDATEKRLKRLREKRLQEAGQ